jgi:hypothetical protein
MVQKFFRQVESPIYGAKHIGGLLGINQATSAREIEEELLRRQSTAPGLLGRNRPRGAQDIENGLRRRQSSSGQNTVAQLLSREAAGARDQLSAEISGFDSQIRIQPDSRLQESYDWRARIRPKGGADGFLNNPYWQGEILRPLRETGGLVIQYTPGVFMQYSSEWNSTHGVGQNYPIMTYSKSQTSAFTINAEFTANTVSEARYLLAVIHFIRTITKSSFGEISAESGRAGTPPPVLLFEYLGEHGGFNSMPVVVTGVTIQYSADVDYVPVVVGGDDGEAITYVPTRIEPAITLQPAYTPNSLRKGFDLDAMIRGNRNQRRFG